MCMFTYHVSLSYSITTMQQSLDDDEQKKADPVSLSDQYINRWPLDFSIGIFDNLFEDSQTIALAFKWKPFTKTELKCNVSHTSWCQRNSFTKLLMNN